MKNIFKVSLTKKTSYLLVIFLGLILFFSLVVLSHYQYQQVKESDLLNAKTQGADILEQINVEEARSFDLLFDNISIIGSLPVVKDFLNQNTSLNRQRVAEIFLQFSTNVESYDQLRFIDLNGDELVRVNHNDGNVTVVSEDQRQNKRDKLYFIESLKLKKGQIYVSPIELYTVDSKIELPYKPILRIALPLFDGDEKKGVLVINYLAQEMFDQIDGLTSSILSYDETNSKANILNSDGYWIHSNNVNDEWGFMFPEKKDKTLANVNSKLWNVMNKSDKGELVTEDGLYSFNTIIPKSKIAPTFKTYKFLSNESIYIDSNNYKNNLVIIFIFVFMVLTTTIFLIIRILSRVFDSNQRSIEDNNKIKAITDSATDAIIMMDNNGLIVFWNPGAEKMLGYTFDEIKGKSLHDFIPVKEEHKNMTNVFRFGETGESQITGKTHELQVKNKVGGIIEAELTVSGIKVDNKWHAVGVMRDITERKKNQEALKSRTNELEDLNKYMVDRELKMVELKSELEKLKSV